MNEQTYLKIKETIRWSPDKSPAGIARWLLQSNIPTMYKIIEDWLTVLSPQYEEIYLNMINYHGRGGEGPTDAQVRILERMEEKGHTLTTIHGRFRWVQGSDWPVYRNTISLMVEKGWIRYEKSTSPGLDYEFRITEAGKTALNLYRMERAE